MGSLWLPKALFIDRGQWAHHAVIESNLLAARGLVVIAYGSRATLTIAQFGCLAGPKALHLGKLLADLGRILAVELACLFKIFFGLLDTEQGDCRIVSCLLRQYDYIKGVLESLHVREERFVSLLSLKRIAPCASEVMNHSISLVVDKQSPQVFDQGLREESFALFDVVLFENFKARKSDFFEIYLQLLAELASVSALLGDCGEYNEHDHAE